MKRAFCLALLALAAALPARAEAPENLIRAELLPGWLAADGRHMAALRLVLAPGWKTYWRQPGEAGIPPVFDWAGSRGLDDLRLHWPAPEVIDVNGMQAIGYHGELVLPFDFAAPAAGGEADIALTVDLGVCKDICVPAQVSVQGRIAGPGAPDSAIARALKSQPVTGSSAGLTRISCEVEPIRDGLRLTARMELPDQGGGEAVVVETADPRVWVSSATTTRVGGGLMAVMDLVPPEAAPFALDRSGLVVTVLGGGGAVEIRGCPAP